MKIEGLTSLGFAISVLALSSFHTGNAAFAADNPVLEIQGDASSGEKLYRRNCRACHGANGKGASSYPKLVGHPSEYLIDKVVRYRAGEEFGPNTPLMAQSVRRLSDKNIADVVAFIMTLEE